jgi:hypothetical protein
MPLIHSTSKQAFGENIAREREAGKPEAQAVAIAYSTKREAAKQHHSRTHEHHSHHSSARSDHYHSSVAGAEVRPVEVLHKFGATTKMHKSEHAPQSAEDFTEKGHKL